MKACSCRAVVAAAVDSLSRRKKSPRAVYDKVPSFDVVIFKSSSHSAAATATADATFFATRRLGISITTAIAIRKRKWQGNKGASFFLSFFLVRAIY